MFWLSIKQQLKQRTASNPDADAAFATTLYAMQTGANTMVSGGSSPFVEWCVAEGVVNNNGDNVIDPERELGYLYKELTLIQPVYGARAEYTGTGWAFNSAVDLVSFAGGEGAIQPDIIRTEAATFGAALVKGEEVVSSNALSFSQDDEGHTRIHEQLVRTAEGATIENHTPHVALFNSSGGAQVVGAGVANYTSVLPGGEIHKCMFETVANATGAGSSYNVVGAVTDPGTGEVIFPGDAASAVGAVIGTGGDTSGGDWGGTEDAALDENFNEQDEFVKKIVVAYGLISYADIDRKNPKPKQLKTATEIHIYRDTVNDDMVKFISSYNSEPRYTKNSITYFEEEKKFQWVTISEECNAYFDPNSIAVAKVYTKGTRVRVRKTDYIKGSESRAQCLYDDGKKGKGNAKHYIACKYLEGVDESAACRTKGHIKSDGLNHDYCKVCRTYKCADLKKKHGNGVCGTQIYCAQCKKRVNNAKQHLLTCGHYSCDKSFTRGHDALDCGHLACEIASLDDHATLDCGHYLCDERFTLGHDALDCGHLACEIVYLTDHAPLGCGVHYACETFPEGAAHEKLPCGAHLKCLVLDSEWHLHEAHVCGEHYPCTDGEASLHALLGCGAHCACETFPQGAAHEKLPCGAHLKCLVSDSEWHLHEAHECGAHYLCNEEDASLHAPLGCGAHCACETFAPGVTHDICSGCNDRLCDGGDHSALDCGHYACAGGDHALLTCGHYACAGGDHGTFGCGHYVCLGGDHDALGCGHYECTGGDHGAMPCGHYECTGGDHGAMPCGHYACAGGSGHDTLRSCGAHYACAGGSGHDTLRLCGAHYECAGGDSAKHTMTHPCGAHYMCAGDSAEHTTIQQCGAHYMCAGHNTEHTTIQQCGAHYMCAGHGTEHTTIQQCGAHYMCAGHSANHITMQLCGAHYLCDTTDPNAVHEELPCGLHLKCVVPQNIWHYHYKPECGFHDFSCDQLVAMLHTKLECGHYVCDPSFGYGDSHDKLPCGKHYACEVQDGAVHEKLPCGVHLKCLVSDSDWHLHEAHDCGEHYLCNKEDARLHAALACGHSACEDGDHTIMHPCGDHYACAPGDEHKTMNVCNAHYMCDTPQMTSHQTYAACGLHYACSINDGLYHSGKCIACLQPFCAVPGKVHGVGLCVAFTCDSCSEEVASKDKHLLACGHYSCDPDAASVNHDMYECGDSYNKHFHCDPAMASLDHSGCSHCGHTKCYRVGLHDIKAPCDVHYECEAASNEPGIHETKCNDCGEFYCAYMAFVGGHAENCPKTPAP